MDDFDRGWKAFEDGNDFDYSRSEQWRDGWDKASDYFNKFWEIY